MWLCCQELLFLWAGTQTEASYLELLFRLFDHISFVDGDNRRWKNSSDITMLEPPGKGVDDYDWNAIYDSDGDSVLPAVLSSAVATAHSTIINSTGDGSTADSTAQRTVLSEMYDPSRAGAYLPRADLLNLRFSRCLLAGAAAKGTLDSHADRDHSKVKQSTVQYSTRVKYSTVW